MGLIFWSVLKMRQKQQEGESRMEANSWVFGYMRCNFPVLKILSTQGRGQLPCFAACDLNSTSGLHLFTHCVRTVFAVLVCTLFLLVHSFLNVCIFGQVCTHAKQKILEHRSKTMLSKVPIYAKCCSIVHQIRKLV